MAEVFCSLRGKIANGREFAVEVSNQPASDTGLNVFSARLKPAPSVLSGFCAHADARDGGFVAG
jgi:hypothetical protein